MTRHLLANLAVLAGAASSQEQWTTSHVAPTGNPDVRMAYHAADRRVVAVSARQDGPELETWEWDGTVWHQRLPVQSPPARKGSALAYDAQRRVLVLFGGTGADQLPLQDTWEWNGATWTRRTSAAAPSPRYSAAMAFHPRTGRVVLFGGQTLGSIFADTWSWDGSNWTQLAPGPVSPGPRAGSAMTGDTQRGMLVLFGGTARPGPVPPYLDDVWEHDGTQWRQATPTLRPPSVRGPSLTFDAQAGRAVLYGGDVGNVANTDVWDWDGSQWRQYPATVTPGLRVTAGLAWDPAQGRVTLFGGMYESSTWLWERATATWRRASPETPRPRTWALTTWMPPNQTLYVDGDGGTFTWDHVTHAWRREAASPQPLPYLAASLAFDTARRQAVLVGEANGGTETWLWHGSGRQWQRQAPAVSPPGTHNGALAYDPVRDRTVLFGGSVGSAAWSAQTWEWDGQNWSIRSPAAAPPARSGAALAYDFLTQHVALFGGVEASGQCRNDVWDWDGTTWAQRSMSVAAPPARSGAAMGGRNDGLLVFGGEPASGPLFGDLWALRGNVWALLTNSGAPPLAIAQASVDTISGELTVFGGRTAGPWSLFLEDTGGIWHYGTPRADETPLGSGCAGSLGTPTLAGMGLPSLGNAAFALSAARVVAQQPALFLIGRTTVLAELPNLCRVLVATPLWIGVATAGAGQGAVLPLPVPAAPELTGAVLHAQAAALDPLGSGISVTQTLRLRLGR